MAHPGSTDVRPLDLPVAGPKGGDGPEWPVQATDYIVGFVDSVRDKTTGPALDIARYVIYGIVILLLLLPVAALALIGTMRLFEGGLLLLKDVTGWAWLHDPMWIVYTIFGALFTLVGFALWGKSKKPARH